MTSLCSTIRNEIGNGDYNNIYSVGGRNGNCLEGVGIYRPPCTMPTKSKVKYTDIAVRSLTCHTATETHMLYRITQCYLPPDRGNIPTLPQPKRLSDPGGMQGCVDLAGLLHTEMVGHTRPKTVTHPSTNRARRALTSFMRRTPLTTTPRHQLDVQVRVSRPR